MGNIFTASRMTTALVTIGIFAALMRVPAVKDAVLNESKLFGIF